MPALEDRALVVAAHWRRNLTVRQLAPLAATSCSARGRRVSDGPCPPCSRRNATRGGR
ncbi:hypothetical protein GTU99_13070 [Streptomyces sp. PRKS01-65]|nr:hypothetical protein [Streptomyces harenosi]